MKIRKIICFGCLLFILAGCNKEKTDHLGKDTPEGTAKESNVEKPIIVTSEEVKTMIENKEKAYVTIGDFDSEGYDLLLENMKEICAEKGVSVYTMNTQDEKNAQWLTENDVQAELNIAFLSFGNRAVGICDMKHEQEYTDIQILTSLLDGVSSALENE
jgi:hypothetical protein